MKLRKRECGTAECIEDPEGGIGLGVQLVSKALGILVFRMRVDLLSLG